MSANISSNLSLFQVLNVLPLHHIDVVPLHSTVLSTSAALASSETVVGHVCMAHKQFKSCNNFTLHRPISSLMLNTHNDEATPRYTGCSVVGMLTGFIV